MPPLLPALYRACPSAFRLTQAQTIASHACMVPLPPALPQGAPFCFKRSAAARHFCSIVAGCCPAVPLPFAAGRAFLLLFSARRQGTAAQLLRAAAPASPFAFAQGVPFCFTAQRGGEAILAWDLRAPSRCLYELATGNTDVISLQVGVVLCGTLQPLPSSCNAACSCQLRMSSCQTAVLPCMSCPLASVWLGASVSRLCCMPTLLCSGMRARGPSLPPLNATILTAMGAGTTRCDVRGVQHCSNVHNIGAGTAGSGLLGGAAPRTALLAALPKLALRNILTYDSESRMLCCAGRH